MTIQPNSYWQFRYQLHKVLDVAFGVEKPGTELWVTTWTVGSKATGCSIVLPAADGACWSWYGPVGDFLEQFQRL